MKKISRTLLGLGSLAMVATFFLPLWQIQLWAPQYPEGLNMKIWHNRLGGSFDIINGLNHYIGMREIKAEMFPEFQYIGILIGIFIAVGLIAALTGSRRWLLVFTGMAFVYGTAALWDFYRWGYDYGHNLDPHAAIVVPGMSYQPPVLGYKNLLNFTAYSGPDQGAWIIIIVGLIASLLTGYEYFFRKKYSKKEPSKSGGKLAAAAFFSIFITSCAVGPEPLKYGHDACALCKMTLTDQRFGAEIVTEKGKVFKFDDLNCMVDFLKQNPETAEKTVQTLAADFSNKGKLLPVQNAFFFKNRKTPQSNARRRGRFFERLRTRSGEKRNRRWPRNGLGFLQKRAF